MIDRYDCFPTTNVTHAISGKICTMFIYKRDVDYKLQCQLNGFSVSVTTSTLVVNHPEQNGWVAHDLTYKSAEPQQTLMVKFDLDSITTSCMLLNELYVLSENQYDVACMSQKLNIKFISKPLQWSDLSENSQKTLKTFGRIAILNHIYEIKDICKTNQAFNALKGHQLNELLRYSYKKEMAIPKANIQLPTKKQVNYKTQKYKDRILRLDTKTNQIEWKSGPIVVLYENTITNMTFYDNIQQHLTVDLSWKTLVLYPVDNVVELKSIQLQDKTIVIIHAKSSYQDVKAKLWNVCKKPQTRMSVRIVEYAEETGPKPDQPTGTFHVLLEDNEIPMRPPKLAFLSDGSGTGKSDFLWNLTSIPPPRNCLPVCFTALEMVSKFNASRDIRKSILSNVTTTEFEAGILKEFKIMVGIDSLDEIELHKRGDLISIIQKLHQQENVSVIACMLPHMEATIAPQFASKSTFFWKFRRMSRNELIEIICNHASSNTEQLVQKATEFVNIYDDKVELTPLLCELLSDLLPDVTEAQDVTPTLMDLYDKITPKLCRRYSLEKLGLSDTHVSQEFYTQIILKAYMHACTNEALTAVYPNFAKNVAQITFTQDERDTFQNMFSKSSVLQIPHRSYKEYFICRIVFRILRGDFLFDVEGHKEKLFAFFKTRYIDNPTQIYDLEGRLKAAGITKSALLIVGNVNIKDITIMHVHSPYTSSLVFHSLLKNNEISLNMYKEDQISVPALFGRDVAKHSNLKVPTSLIICALKFGNYELFRELYNNHMDYIDFNEIASVLSPKMSSLMHIVMHQIRYDDDFTITQKKLLLKLLMKVRHSVNYLSVNRPFICNYPILLETNDKLESILHDNPTGQSYLDFLTCLQKNFKPEFYQLVNSLNRDGMPVWTFWRVSGAVPESILKQIDFGVKSATGKLVAVVTNIVRNPAMFDRFVRAALCAIHNLSAEHFNILIDMFQTVASVKQDMVSPFAQMLSNAKLITPKMSEEMTHSNCTTLREVYQKYADADSTSNTRKKKLMKDFSIETVEEHFLKPFYAAKYIAEVVKSGQTDKQFWTVWNTVLRTNGVSFLYPEYSYLLNELLSQVSQHPKLLFDDKYFLSDDANDNQSCFAVAIKTSHNNIAKLLSTSFKAEYISNLSNFEILCFFRAVLQHCDATVAETIQAKLKDANFEVPDEPMKEALATENKELEIFCDSFKRKGEKVKF